MNRIILIHALASSLVACTTGDAADTADTAVPTESDLPDLTDGLDQTGCEDVQGTPTAGAVSYFHGMFTRSGDSWIGTESWLLYANTTWQDFGEGDCRVVWDLRASEVGTTTCGNCDLGLSVEATIDLARTDCPEDLYTDSEQFSVVYEVQRSNDGTANWYFATSGEALGSGYHETDAMNYLTAHQCVWF